MADLQEAIRTSLPPDESPTTARRAEPQGERVRVDSLRLELAAAVAAVADACEEMLKPLETTRFDMDDLLSLDSCEAAEIPLSSVVRSGLDSAGMSDLLELDVDKWNDMDPQLSKMEVNRYVGDSREEPLKKLHEVGEGGIQLPYSTQCDDQGGEMGDEETVIALLKVTQTLDKDSVSVGEDTRVTPTLAPSEIDQSTNDANEQVEERLDEEVNGHLPLRIFEQAASSPSVSVSSLHEQGGVWMSYVTDDGVPYYYNSQTQESQWTRPDIQTKVYPGDAIFDAAAGREPFASEINNILQSGISIEDCNNSGLTPLHVACQKGNVHAVMEFIRHGANINAQRSSALSYGETPLWEACRESHLKIIKLLLSAGCRQNVTDLKANTILHFAVQTKNGYLLSFLLENCDVLSVNLPNSDGETPLHLAAQVGFVEGMQLLLEHDAAIEVEDSQGRTALVLSIMGNHIKCVQLLQNSDQSKIREQDPAAATQLVTESEGVSEDMTMEDLQSYLFQLLEGSDSRLYNAFYQFASGVHSHFTGIEQELEDLKRKDESHEANTKNMATTIAELNQKLTMAHETAEALVAEKTKQYALEFQALQNSCRTLQARCDMLDSVARSTQEKLQRERLEFAHYEQQLQEQIHNCLVENKDLLISTENLRATWNQQLREDYQDGKAQIYEEKYDTHGDATIHVALNQQLYLHPNGENYEQVPDISKSTHFATNRDLLRESDRDLDYVKSSNQHDIEEVIESPPTVSPARVDAVWNRFFENLAKSADSQNPPTTNPPLQNENLRSQPQISSAQSAHIQASLFDAIRKSHLEYLEELLLDGLSPNMRDIGEKGTPLHLACELGDLEAVMLLCEYVADLESRDESSNTPLHVSCFQGHYDCTKFLLQSAANLAAVNANGDTSLHLAAWDGSFACVEILVEYGIDIFSTNNFGLTALANLKTRSPLRHRFDDLADDHPMRQTIMLLEECEILDEEKKANNLVDKALTTRLDDQTTSDGKTNKATWKDWIFGLGHSKGHSEIRDPSVDGETNEEQFADSDESEDENEVDHEEEESISSDSEEYHLDESLSPLKYELVRPPPEIEAELRRAAERVNQRIDSLAPPVPVSANDMMNKRALLSPMQRIVASSTQKKKLPSSPSTIHVRARYVDTFNPTTI